MNTIESIFQSFLHKETYNSHKSISEGLINDTYKVTALSGKSFILQKINQNVFQDAESLIINKTRISNHLLKTSAFKASEYFKTKNNEYHLNLFNGVWTLSGFLEGTTCFKTPVNSMMAYHAGVLLGDFHRSLMEFDINKLTESIPDFHDLDHRITEYETGLKKANEYYMETAKEEIYLIEKLKAEAVRLHDLMKSGAIPIRAVHNDAKLSNMLFDESSSKPVALIDLDTVMPGIIHYDIGDALRSVCIIGNEDEKDINEASLNTKNYKAFLQGYLSNMKNHLEAIEKETLSLSLKYMLYEQGLRFLTDYLNGSVYYKTDYPEHNLVRARNQLEVLLLVNKRSDEINYVLDDVLNP